MEKATLRTPFFVVNPKSYLYGDDILALAKKTDELAEKYDFDGAVHRAVDRPAAHHRRVPAPHSVRSAHGEPQARPRHGPRAARGARRRGGVRATFLNHAENPLTAHELAAAIARADEVGILTVGRGADLRRGGRVDRRARARRHGVRAHAAHRHRPGRGRGLHARLHRGRQGGVAQHQGAAGRRHLHRPGRVRRHQVRRRRHGRHLRHRRGAGTCSPRWTRCSGRSTAPARTSTGGREAMTVYKDLITMDTPAGRPAYVDITEGVAAPSRRPASGRARSR